MSMLRIQRKALVCVLALSLTMGVTVVLSAALAGASTSDGNIVYALHPAGKGERVFVVRPDGTGLRVLRLPGTDCRECIRLSRDGTRLLTAALGAGKRITTATIKLDGSGYKVIPLPGKTLNLGPGEWSPNGRRIAFEGWDDTKASRNGLYTGSSTDGSRLRRVTHSPGSGHDLPLQYSPDGSRILFVRSNARSNEDLGNLYVVRVDGGRPRKLNPLGTSVHWQSFVGGPASWAADGRTIAFAAFTRRSGAKGRSAVFTNSPNGGNLRRITPWGSWTTSAHFSPDGRSIVFDRDAGDGFHDLLVIRPDGSGVKTIVSAAADGLGSCCAAWSPDGTHLLFQRGDVEAATLWTVRADGTGLDELSKVAGLYSRYLWGP